MNFTYKESKCFLGRSVVLSDGTIELEVTLDVGPRIISLNKIGGENIMFQDVGDSVNRDCSEVYGEGETWHIYGGHRMWLSPEDESTYYPDNDAVSVEFTETGAVFTPKQWKVCALQPSLEIVMIGNGTVELRHTFKNCSKDDKKLCIWVLTVLKTGGELTVPLSTEDTGLLANRNLVFWSYTNLSDPRISITDTELKLKGVTGSATNIKIGLYKKDLKAIYRLGDTTLVKTLQETGSPEEYPDFNCNLETYTSALIHEIETLSPMKTVKSGEALTHKEIWEVK